MEESVRMSRKDDEHCEKCIWHVQGFACRTVACGYSLCYGHTSRIKLHYDRIGRESLEGFRHGIGCPEFMAGNPNDKMSLLTDDPKFISPKGWEVLAREQERDAAIVKQKRKRRLTTKKIDPEKLRELRHGRTYREIGAALGISAGAMKRNFERGCITQERADRLREKFGIDILKNSHLPDPKTEIAMEREAHKEFLEDEL